MQLVHDLPPDLPAAIFIVLHIPAHSPSLLPDILDRSGSLKAIHPTDDMPIERGCIYVAPADQHMLLDKGRVRLTRGPRENRHRPAIDPLFRSAALVYGARVVGVVLTGSLDDGTAGLLAIKQRKGIVVVQDPKEALYPSMPQSALNHVQVDYRKPIAQIGPLLARLAHEPAADDKAYPASEDMQKEVRIAEMDINLLGSDKQVGTPSVYSCPECGGVLWEMQDGNLLRFRCRVGHAFSIESVLAEQSDALERTLWAALKSLEENASLSRRMANSAHQNGHARLQAMYEKKSREAEQHAETLRQVLTKYTNTARMVPEDGETQEVDHSTQESAGKRPDNE